MNKWNRKDKRDGSASINRLFVNRRILPHPDGGLIVSSEHSYSMTYDTPNSIGTKSTDYANEIFNFRITTEGEITWFNVVNKRQGGDDRMISYACMNTLKGNTYFFYNEDEDSVEKNLTGKTKKSKSKADGEIITSIISLTPEGKTDRKGFTDASDAKLTILPGHCRQIGNNQMFIYVSCPRPMSDAAIHRYGRVAAYKFGTIVME